MHCSATYLDGKRSRSYPAVVHLLSDEVRVEDENGNALERAMFVNITLSPPLSNRDRFLKFAGGARCQLSDPEMIRLLDRHLGSSPQLALVHLLESSWRMVVMSCGVLIALTWGFMAYGIPGLARHVAMAAPPAIMNQLSEKSVEMLDERFFAPSELGEGQKGEIRGLFRPVCAYFSGDGACTGELLFRKGGQRIGANAFALPSGQIIITDELIGLSRSAQEIEGVLAHEMAHVQERHSVRHALQQTGVFLLISALVGDIGSISSLATTLPMVLVESGYSRKFEEEADRISCLYQLGRGKTSRPYQAILSRMTQGKPSDSSVFSTHPATAKRIALMQEIEEGYRRDGR